MGPGPRTPAKGIGELRPRRAPDPSHPLRAGLYLFNSLIPYLTLLPWGLGGSISTPLARTLSHPMTSLYLDHAATSPLRPRVLEAMEDVRASAWANPSSLHGPGRQARRRLEAARERVAALLGYTPREVHFVRGGTEANNLALLGTGLGEDGNRWTPSRPERPVAISPIEHASVTGPAERLERLGVPILRLPLRRDGTIPAPALAEALGRRPRLMSVQAVNSETGLRIELAPVLEAAAAEGVPVHVDAVQAAGRVPLPRPEGRALLLTLSGHKLGGPRGTAVLAVPASTALRPLHAGGDQEHGLRPGTEDVEGAAGFAEALALALEEADDEVPRLSALRDDLERSILARHPEARVQGSEGARAPHLLHLGFPGIAADLFLGALDIEGIAASAGSACRSGVPGVSPALRALYGDALEGLAPLRLSLGWNSSRREIEAAGAIVGRVLRRLRELDLPSTVPARAGGAG